MAESASQLIEIACPCCGSTLRIDPETRTVIQHREPVKKPLIEDLQAAVQQLKGDADRRNDIFEKSFASHLSSEKVREKKFEELLKQAKEDKSDTPPKRLFDLD
jgi:cation transport regulator ChaB